MFVIYLINQLKVKKKFYSRINSDEITDLLYIGVAFEVQKV